MIKKKSFLGLSLIISFVIIVAAVVVSLTLGINTGTDIAGGTQFEISIEGSVASKESIQTIKDVLKDNNLSYESVFVEDKNLETKVVVRLTDKNIEHQAQIKLELAENLENVEVEDISAFETIGGTVTKRAILYAGITIVCVLLAVFIAALLRYNVISALSLVFVLLYSLILNTSMLVLTRIPITKVLLAIVLAMQAILLLVFVLLLEKLRAESKLKVNDGLTTFELVDKSQKALLKPALFSLALILVVSIALVCVPVRFVTLSACGMLVTIVATALAYYFIGVPMHERLMDLKLRADKLKMSRNVSPEPQKNKNKNEK